MFKGYIETFLKGFQFRGRASRAEFWNFFLIHFLLIIGVMLLTLLNEKASFLYFLYVFIVFIPQLALFSRRLHDMGENSNWLWLILLPYLGTFILLIWVTAKGQEGENKYG